MLASNQSRSISGPHAAPPADLFSRWSWYAAAAATVSLPLIVSSSGSDAFRLPKDVLFLVEGLLLAAIGILRVLARRPDFAILRRSGMFVLGAAIILWTSICTILSTNRAESVSSLIWVTAGVSIAWSLAFSLRGRSISAVYWLVIPAEINAAIFLLQRFHIWNPFIFSEVVPAHHRYTALLGNPDDAGSYLVAPALAIVVLAILDKPPRRLLWIASSLLTALAIATGPVTSLLAFLTGLTVLMLVAWRRVGLVAVVALLAAAIAFAATYPPLRQRVLNIATTARAGNFDEAFSGRVTPFLSALLMAKDHPIVGVGPGGFRWAYYPYKLEIERQHPHLIRAFAHPFNFGQTHNDQLQTLAETGVAGYVLFLLALILIARGSLRAVDAGSFIESPRSQFARLTALPLASSLFVLTLAHFPLRLAAATSAYLFLSVTCVVWNRSAVLVSRGPAGGRPQRRTLRIIAGSAVLILFLGAGRRWCYEPYRCNRVKKYVEVQTKNSLRGQPGAGRARQAHHNLSLLSPCLENCPHDVELLMLAAGNDRLLGRADDAADMYEKALRRDRRPELYYDLALVQLELGRRSDAVSNLVQAVLFDRDILRAMREDVPDEIRTEIMTLLSSRYRYFVLALK